MKNILFLFVLFCPFLCQGQAAYAYITDPDGYTNVRAEPSIKGKVIAKVYKDEYFLIEGWDDPNTSWLEIYGDIKEGFVEGYIHRSRVQMLRNLEVFDKKQLNEHEWLFSYKNMRIRILTQDFKGSAHRISRGGPCGGNVVCKIDGVDPWGVDGNMPKEEFTSIHFSDGNDELHFPKEAFLGLFEPDVNGALLAITPEKKIIFCLQNSDGAGAYTLFFEIQNGQYLRRITKREF